MLASVLRVLHKSSGHRSLEMQVTPKACMSPNDRYTLVDTRMRSDVSQVRSFQSEGCSTLPLAVLIVYEGVESYPNGPSISQEPSLRLLIYKPHNTLYFRTLDPEGYDA